MTIGRHAKRLLQFISIALACAALPASSHADVFKSGWVLDGAKSSLTYEAVLNNTTIETHTFSGLEGKIEADGTTTISIDLASIETQDDLRDTRMRFVLFETFKFPKATISTTLDERLFVALDDLGRLHHVIRAGLDLHGVRNQITADTVATMLDEETVSIASVDPVILRAKDFRFTDGLQNLQEVYFGTTAPMASVSFDLVFKALPHVEQPVAVAGDSTDTGWTIVNGRSTAVESRYVCLARLREMPSAGRVNFRNGSHQLSSESLITLAEVAGAIRPCEALKITVAGHTDAVGNEASNVILSQRRADHVAEYLVRLGLPKTRVVGKGYGETRPIAPNDTAENRSKNRRVEFRVNEG